MANLDIGQIVRVRSRQYLIEEVIPGSADTRVRLSCLEDDALGESLEVFWEREVDAQYIGATSWDAVAQRGFDNPWYFSAYFDTSKRLMYCSEERRQSNLLSLIPAFSPLLLSSRKSRIVSREGRIVKSGRSDCYRINTYSYSL